MSTDKGVTIYDNAGTPYNEAKWKMLLSIIDVPYTSTRVARCAHSLVADAGFLQNSDTVKFLRDYADLLRLRDASAQSVKRTEVLPAVIADMQARVDKGSKEYGERLTTHNGRRALQDAYEEAMDMALYLKQELMERGQ